ncbi:MAG: hypothetical protein NDI84_07980 [Steroidobacteraceae bacterium]|nr:hypothetical protein [Steroidobacteraceae bacterium]
MSTATDLLAAYMAAELDLLQGKETRLGDRMLRHEDLAEIRKGRMEWEQRVASELAQATSRPRIGGLQYKVADLSGE